MEPATGPNPLVLTPTERITLVRNTGNREHYAHGELTLKNTITTKRVVYKIKTTAPKNYLVKPSSGMIPAGGEVTVSLSCTKTPTMEAGGKSDRFLIQSFVENTPTPIPMPKEIWTQPRDMYFDQRIAVDIDQGPAAVPAANDTVSQVASSHAPADDLVSVTSVPHAEVSSPQPTSTVKPALAEEEKKPKSASAYLNQVNIDSKPPPPSHHTSRSSDTEELVFTPTQVAVIVVATIVLLKIVRIL